MADDDFPTIKTGDVIKFTPLALSFPDVKVGEVYKIERSPVGRAVLVSEGQAFGVGAINPGQASLVTEAIEAAVTASVQDSITIEVISVTPPGGAEG